VILADLDDFKGVNDSEGHAAGDAVLKDVAYLVRKRLRAFDLAYRLGGDEFLVLVRGADLDLGRDPRVEVREQLYKGTRKRLKSRAGERDLPLSPGMKARLLVLRRASGGGQRSPVFASRAGAPLSPQNVYARVLAPPALRAGLTVEVEASVFDEILPPPRRGKQPQAIAIIPVPAGVAQLVRAAES
jgi:Diguanylate cyclase, GGDEF domain